MGDALGWEDGVFRADLSCDLEKVFLFIVFSAKWSIEKLRRKKLVLTGRLMLEFISFICQVFLKTSTIFIKLTRGRNTRLS